MSAETTRTNNSSFDELYTRLVSLLEAEFGTNECLYQILKIPMENAGYKEPPIDKNDVIARYRKLLVSIRDHFPKSGEPRIEWLIKFHRCLEKSGFNQIYTKPLTKPFPAQFHVNQHDRHDKHDKHDKHDMLNQLIHLACYRDDNMLGQECDEKLLKLFLEP